MFIRPIVLATAATLTASPAIPCAFHGYSPKATMVERLLGSDHIVLARPTLAQPFRYADIDVLEGDTNFIEIPHLVDSFTRRRLTANPDDRVLFARDGSYGPWERVAYVNDDMDQVLQVVLKELQTWQMGGDPERFAYFASLLDHQNYDVHMLALRELDLADYGELRKITPNVSSERIMSRLNSRSETELKPIRILLMGLLQEGVDLNFFDNGLRNASEYSGGLIGAYSTAMIEYGGPEAVERVIQHHLMHADATPMVREMLIEALAIHSSTGNKETRAAIQSELAAALKKTPELAPMVARQFGTRWNWSQSEQISELMRSGQITSPLDMLVLSQYVAMAKESAELSQD